MNNHTKYVLITPAKNEERLIGATLESVVNQTVRPAEWIIVSDGSTDRTNEIVSAAASTHPWIRLLALPPTKERNFAAVVRATELGVKTLATQDYQYIGLLDSDVRFAPDYFEKVLETCEESPRLGMTGGVVIDIGTPKDRLPRNREDIPGAAQFFRRSCFEELGGLVAIPEGGWDALTCARARMLGYETRLLTHVMMDHLKPRNIAEGGLIRRLWQFGVRDYAIGYHPLFELMKCAGRVRTRPLFFGSLIWWLGYCSALLRRHKRYVPASLLKFLHREQKQRMLKLFRLAR